MGAFHLHVRLAAGEVAPPRPWVGDEAKWVHLALQHTEMEHHQ